jgi:hypothetical protein
MIEKVNKAFLRSLFRKEYGYYPHLYRTKRLLDMLGYKSPELRRNLSLLRFVLQLMRGSISWPPLLESIGLNMPINFLRGRQHEYLAVPASRTDLYRMAPIPRAIRYINGIITDDPKFDVYHMKKGKLYAIAYLSKQFCSNDEED